MATDRGEAIKLLDHNIAANTTEEHRIKRVELSWGEDQESQPDIAQHRPIDLIAVSECIYNLQYAPHLLKTLTRLCDATTRVLFSFTIRNPEEEQSFFDHKVSQHFDIRHVRVSLFSCDPQSGKTDSDVGNRSITTTAASRT